MTRRDLLARMGEDELREWVALDRIYPLHDPYLAAGIIAAANARLWGAKGRDGDPEYYRPVKVAKKPEATRPRANGAALLARIRRAREAADRKGS